MKIGIFGDSFADIRKYNSTPNWIDLLKERYNKVQSFGLVGTNLYYSMKIFINQYKNFDKNIFVITSPYRIWANRFSISPQSRQFFQGIDSIEARIDFEKKNNKDPQSLYTNIKILEAVQVYYSYIQNIEEENYKHRLMIKEILSLDPNTLLVPCYNTSMPNIDVGLFNIFEKENAAWGIDDTTTVRYDTRNCHMTAENNAILSQKMISCIENNIAFSLNIDDYVTPMNKEFYIR